MNYLRKSYRTFKGKRKYPWLYRREDVLDDTISFSELFDKEFEEHVETLIGEWINDDYFIISFLGRGTFSLVYMAYSITKKDFVVLKLILPCYNQEGKYERDIIEEIIQHNSHFPYQIFKWKKHPRVIFIEQPCYGIPMADLVKREDYPSLPIDTIITFFYHCLTQIDSLHKSNIIHTDIKLDNILSSYTTDYIKDIQSWFLSKKPINWIHGHAQFNKSQNSLRRIKWSWNKCLRVAKKEFKTFFLREYSIFKKKRNDKKLAELENVKEVEDFDTYKSDSLAEVNHDFIIDMTEKPHAAIIDFGNAIIDDEIEPDDICYENYRPPENMIRLEITKKSDIWCMGCIFYEMLTGKFLFDFETETNNNTANVVTLQEHTEETEYEDRKDSVFSIESINSFESNDIQRQNLVEIYNVCSSEEQERIDNIKNLLQQHSIFKIDENILQLITEMLASMLDCVPNTRKHACEILKMNLFKPFVYDNLQSIDIEV